ncbi:hypothetical protein ACXO8X_02435 [Lactobacillus delbrueckii subsp. bulgaricus]|nr:hypothetical protein [Lactobacillus delbrueckii subsp. bulgaricus]
MSTAEFALTVATCALLCIILFCFDNSYLRTKINKLEKESLVTRTQDKYYKEIIDSLTKRIDQNDCDIRQLSESCSQVDDLGIEIRVCQKDVEHALEMIEELKAKRSMDILDELRKEDKE